MNRRPGGHRSRPHESRCSRGDRSFPDGDHAGVPGEFPTSSHRDVHSGLHGEAPDNNQLRAGTGVARGALDRRARRPGVAVAGMDGQCASASGDEHPSSNPIGLSVSELRRENGDITFSGEYDGTVVAEIEAYDRDPEGWTTYRKADFDFAGDLSVTFTGQDVTDVWLVTAEPNENEWCGRASRIHSDSCRPTAGWSRTPRRGSAPTLQRNLFELDDTLSSPHTRFAPASIGLYGNKRQPGRRGRGSSRCCGCKAGLSRRGRPRRRGEDPLTVHGAVGQRRPQRPPLDRSWPQQRDRVGGRRTCVAVKGGVAIARRERYPLWPRARQSPKCRYQVFQTIVDCDFD